ncbi:MAG: OmpA family protein [Caulobacteraceae bacterium]|nr:OmpA family protein [Caulobacteraceae bacterium]
MIKIGIVGAILLGATSLSGCATKKYVDQQVGQVSTQVQADGTRLSDHDAKLADLDKTSREALERAQAAGKLAEGKFLYSLVLSDDTVKFGVNRAELSADDQAKLTAFAEKLKADNHNVYVEIQGHTDASGPKQYNYRLGEERAEAARRFLNQQGVALNRLATISYGPDAPVQPNKTREGRAANRRIVLVVLS